jgi:hypothetical protein
MATQKTGKNGRCQVRQSRTYVKKTAAISNLAFLLGFAAVNGDGLDALNQQIDLCAQPLATITTATPNLNVVDVGCIRAKHENGRRRLLQAL